MQPFADQCLQVLTTANPAQKAATALAITLKQSIDLRQSPKLQPPDKPARPDNLQTVTPGNAPKRKWGSEQGRLVLLHAIAHIELNAIDLAFDMITRFAFHPPIAEQWSDEFCADWLRVGQEEAKHYGLLTELMKARGMAYGDLPVHGGMWDAALGTMGEVDARLAIAPLVLEARGLDVTPPMIAKLKQVGDHEAAKVLQIIYDEEIGHVAIGAKWFKRVCQLLDADPQTHFKQMVGKHFSAGLKPPFNIEARTKAGLPRQFYS